MNTQSIKDYVYSLKNIDECTELTINKIDIDGEILAVDLNDLYKFPNLNSLSLCNMTIGENDMMILSSLPKLKTLKLYNCDFSNNDLYFYFNNLSIDELFIDNTEINFNLIKKKFDMVTARNVIQIYNINCNELNISKADSVDFERIEIKKYNKITVSKSQYLHNKTLFKNNNGVEISVVDEYYNVIGDIDD